VCTRCKTDVTAIVDEITSKKLCIKCKTDVTPTTKGFPS